METEIYIFKNKNIFEKHSFTLNKRYLMAGYVTPLYSNMYAINDFDIKVKINYVLDRFLSLYEYRKIKINKLISDFSI